MRWAGLAHRRQLAQLRRRERPQQPQPAEEVHAALAARPGQEEVQHDLHGCAVSNGAVIPAPTHKVVNLTRTRINYVPIHAISLNSGAIDNKVGNLTILRGFRDSGAPAQRPLRI